MKVEGEVNATAPVRTPPPYTSPSRPAAPIGAGIAQASMKPDLPELRDFIRTRRAALAGFMEQGASLALSEDVLTVNARNDIYIRYLNDNKNVIAELASEHLGRAIRVELSTNGAVNPAATRATTALASNGVTRELPPAISAAPAAQPIAAENAPKRMAPSRPIESIREIAPASMSIEAARRAATPEERQAVLADPSVRRVFDTLDARLVELKMPNSVEASAKESKE